MRHILFVLITALLILPNSVSAGLFDDGKKKFEKIGDALQYIPVYSGYLVAFGKDDIEGVKQLTRSSLIDVVATQATKSAFNDTELGVRPNGGDKSFVSGHASLACTGSAFLGERYGWKYGVPFFAVAATVAASRVDANKHHVRDVVAGCGLAYVINEFFVTKLGEEQLHPVVGPDFLGFRWKFDF